jgi:hypothetical protein
MSVGAAFRSATGRLRLSDALRFQRGIRSLERSVPFGENSPCDFGWMVPVLREGPPEGRPMQALGRRDGLRRYRRRLVRASGGAASLAAVKSNYLPPAATGPVNSRIRN